MWILLLTHFPLHGPRKVSQKVTYNDFRPYPLISLREAKEFFEQFSLTSSLESTITDCTSKENVTFRFLNFCSSFWNFSIPIYMLTKSCDHMMTLLIGLDKPTLTSCFNWFCRLPLLWSFPHLRFTTSVDFCSELHCVISIFNLGTEFLLFKILPCLVLNVAEACAQGPHSHILVTGGSEGFFWVWHFGQKGFFWVAKTTQGFFGYCIFHQLKSTIT